MNKEKFLYDFLVKYNIKEKEIIDKYGVNVNDCWIKNDNDSGQEGLVLYILRNLLAHDTEATLNNLPYKFEFDIIIKWVNTLQLNKDEKLMLLEFILQSSKVETDLADKCFHKLENDDMKNTYYCYYRKLDGLYFNIFLHPKGRFITCDISTYNHSNGSAGREYYMDTDIYVESEFVDGEIVLKLFKDKESLPPKLEIHLKKKSRAFDNAVIQLGYFRLMDELYVERRFVVNNDSCCEDTQYLSYLDNLEEIKGVFKSEFDLDKLYEIYSKVVQQYKEINQILQKIGVQL